MTKRTLLAIVGASLAVVGFAGGRLMTPDQSYQTHPAVQRLNAAHQEFSAASEALKRIPDSEKWGYVPQASRPDYSVSQAYTPAENAIQRMECARGVVNQCRQDPVVQEYLHQGHMALAFYLAAAAGLCAVSITYTSWRAPQIVDELRAMLPEGQR